MTKTTEQLAIEALADAALRDIFESEWFDALDARQRTLLMRQVADNATTYADDENNF